MDQATAAARDAPARWALSVPVPTHSSPQLTAPTRPGSAFMAGGYRTTAAVDVAVLEGPAQTIVVAFNLQEGSAASNSVPPDAGEPRASAREPGSFPVRAADPRGGQVKWWGLAGLAGLAGGIRFLPLWRQWVEAPGSGS